MMKTRYSDFTKERVYEVYKVVAKFVDPFEDEMDVCDVYDVIEINKIAIPNTVYDIVYDFVEQYVVPLIDEDASFDEKGHLNLTMFEPDEEDLPSLTCGKEFVEWTRVKRTFEAIADVFIRPILMDE